MNPYFTFLNSLSKIDDDDFSALTKLSKYVKAPANTELAQIGKTPKNGYLIISGIVRAYVTLESGKQFNKRLYISPAFCGDLTALIKNKPSVIGIETLTQCSFFEINFTKFKTLCLTNINLCRLYSKVLEHSFFAYEERNIDLLTLTGRERYFKLKQQIPNIDKLIPQYQIASYLGISPIQLSRIRKPFIHD